MSFPMNPVHDQIAVVNGIKYIYSSIYNAWRRDFNNVLDRLFLVGRNEAINTYTGDLVVYGGASFGGNVVVGGQILGTINTATNLSGGTTGTMFYQSSTGTTFRLDPGATGTVLTMIAGVPEWSGVIFAAAPNLAGGDIDQIPFQLANTTTGFTSNFRYSPNTGTLYIGNATSSTSISSGAIVTQGGIGVAGDVNIGGNMNVAGSLNVAGTLTYIQSTSLEVVDKNIVLAKGAASAIDTDNAGITIDFVNANLVYDADTDAWTTNKSFLMQDAQIGVGTESDNPFGGALRVAGGLGVSGNLNVGSSATIVGSVLPYTSSAFDLGTPTRKWRDLYLSGSTIYLGSVTLKEVGGAFLVNNVAIGGTLPSTNTSTNIAGGSRGGIVYQTGTGLTAVLPIGATGTFVSSNGSLPIWTTAVTSLVAGTGTFISSSTGAITIWNSQIGVGIGSPFSGIFTITNTTTASSTVTGALQVQGGAGIGGRVYANGYNHLNLSSDNESEVIISSYANNQSIRISPRGTGTIVLSSSTAIVGTIKYSVQDIPALSSTTIWTLTTSSFTGNLITMNPTVGTSDVYIPIANSSLGGYSFIFANRSTTFSVRMRAGTVSSYTSIGVITTGTSKEILCDGFRWYLMN